MWLAHVAGGLPGAQASVAAGLVGVACLGCRARGERAPCAAAGGAGSRGRAGARRRAVAHPGRRARRAGRAADHLPRRRPGRRDADAVAAQRDPGRRRSAGRPGRSRACAMPASGGSTLLVVTHAQADHDGGAPPCWARSRWDSCSTGATASARPTGRAMAAAARAAPRAPGRRRAPARCCASGRVALRVLWPRARAEPSPGRTPTSARSSPRPMPAACARCSPPTPSPTCSARLDLGPVDVLKVSHHGSADPGLPALLQRLRPRLAAIEVGRHNVYGHPARVDAPGARCRGRGGRAHRSRRHRPASSRRPARCASTAHA